MTNLTRAEKKENRKSQKAQRASVSQFAVAMVGKLELRNEKDQQGALLGREKDQDIWYYFKRLKIELAELQGALKRHDNISNTVTRDAVLGECCDIANFAAAIAEKAAEGI